MKKSCPDCVHFKMCKWKPRGEGVGSSSSETIVFDMTPLAFEGLLFNLYGEHCMKYEKE